MKTCNFVLISLVFLAINLFGSVLSVAANMDNMSTIQQELVLEHPLKNTTVLNLASPGFGIQYSRDIFSRISLGGGVGYSFIYNNLILDLIPTERTSAVVVPLFVRFYPLFYRHRPFVSLGASTLMPITQDAVNNLAPAYIFPFYSAGYEFRSLSGFIFQVGYEGQFNISKDFKKSYQPGLILSIGLSY